MRGLLIALLAASCAPTGVARIVGDAQRLEPSLESDLARRFVRASIRLPHIGRHTIAHGGKTLTVDEEFFYVTKYGSPLAYARPLDLLSRAGLSDVRGARILDFGYGNVGHLLLLHALGAEAVGVDVDPLLPKIYADVRQVLLVDGRFPVDARARDQVGAGFDLVISKNVLKRGYIHPAEPVDERKQIRLGVDDETFVRTLYEILRPGGRFLIYNLCPAPAPPGQPYVPWADGRSPFSQAQLERAGFRIRAFDLDDTRAARAMARALGWDRGPDAMDLARDLFAWYTLAEKPGP